MASPSPPPPPPPPPPLNTLIPAAHSTSSPFIPLTQPISIKLDDSNYLSWESQVLPAIQGHGLSHFIENPQPPPPTFTNAAGHIVPNPAFQIWQRQDRLLLSWLRASLSDSLVAQVVSSRTAADLWTSLHDSFAESSPTRIDHLYKQLQSLSKGSSTCKEYIRRVKAICDELALLGSSPSEPELIRYTLAGLGADFNPLRVALSTRSQPLTLRDLQSFLLANEPFLAAAAAPSFLPSSSQPVAFYSSQKPQFQPPRPSYPFRPPRPSFQQGPRRPPGPRTPRPPLLNTPQPTTNFQPTVQQPSAPPHTEQPLFCQICEKKDHSARSCWYRCDMRYFDQPPQAYHVQPIPPPQPPSFAPHEWCVDSGATHHVTHDINNLTSYVMYQGNEALQIGTGEGIPISHIGSTTILVSNNAIHLCDILHVPTFTRNLLSLSKLLLDNSILIEFSSFLCLIKDRQTKNLILQAPLSNGLFILHLPSPSTSPQAFFGQCISANGWHARLGHPSSLTLFSPCFKTAKITNISSKL